MSLSCLKLVPVRMSLAGTNVACRPPRPCGWCGIAPSGDRAVPFDHRRRGPRNMGVQRRRGRPGARALFAGSVGGHQRVATRLRGTACQQRIRGTGRPPTIPANRALRTGRTGWAGARFPAEFPDGTAAAMAEWVRAPAEASDDRNRGRRGIARSTRRRARRLRARAPRNGRAHGARCGWISRLRPPRPRTTRSRPRCRCRPPRAGAACRSGRNWWSRGKSAAAAGAAR
jgi:hypothetical protein